MFRLGKSRFRSRVKESIHMRRGNLEILTSENSAAGEVEHIGQHRGLGEVEGRRRFAFAWMNA
jgi:hypothetical protein